MSQDEYYYFDEKEADSDPAREPKTLAQIDMEEEARTLARAGVIETTYYDEEEQLTDTEAGAENRRSWSPQPYTYETPLGDIELLELRRQRRDTERLSTTYDENLRQMSPQSFTDSDSDLTDDEFNRQFKTKWPQYNTGSDPARKPKSLAQIDMEEEASTLAKAGVFEAPRTENAPRWSDDEQWGRRTQ